MNIESVAYHRNGIGGDPFYAVLFHDPKVAGSRFIGIVPSIYVPASDGEDADLTPTYNSDSGCVPCYVLDVRLAAQGNIEFGSNSWRGDNYFPELVEAAQTHAEALLV